MSLIFYRGGRGAAFAWVGASVAAGLAAVALAQSPARAPAEAAERTPAEASRSAAAQTPGRVPAEAPERSAVDASSPAAATPAVAAAQTPDVAALEARLAALEARRDRLADESAIKRLQRAYGYYFDKALWDDVAQLFADDGTIEIGLDGVYEGKARIREYLYARTGGRSGLAHGELNEHLQLMPVVTVAPDGESAKARWRALIMAGRFGERAVWGEGPYENEYVKEAGVWKIKKLHWYQTMLVPYEGGWQTNVDANGGHWVPAELTPDRPPSESYVLWPDTPDTYVPAYHFPNPVAVYTGPGSTVGGAP